MENKKYHYKVYVWKIPKSNIKIDTSNTQTYNSSFQWTKQTNTAILRSSKQGKLTPYVMHTKKPIKPQILYVFIGEACKGLNTTSIFFKELTRNLIGRHRLVKHAKEWTIPPILIVYISEKWQRTNQTSNIFFLVEWMI